jgi:AGCS family alanine or glycine:cation symporter
VLAIGCMIELRAVLDFSDAMVFLIAVPNILGLYFFAPEVRRDVRAFIAAVRRDDVPKFRDGASRGQAQPAQS